MVRGLGLFAAGLLRAFVTLSCLVTFWDRAIICCGYFNLDFFSTYLAHMKAEVIWHLYCYKLLPKGFGDFDFIFLFKKKQQNLTLHLCYLPWESGYIHTLPATLPHFIDKVIEGQKGLVIGSRSQNRDADLGFSSSEGSVLFFQVKEGQAFLVWCLSRPQEFK